MEKESFISIISPVYNAEKIIPELVRRVEEEIKKITTKYEIILIEDCSKDNSWKEINLIAKKNNKIKAVKFSRNFGQHVAIKSGLELSKGDCCIVMDCDLQDNPIYIKDLVSKWNEGYDIVFTQKNKRAHSKFKNITAVMFNKIFNYLVDTKISESNKNIGSFSLLSRKATDAFKKFNDYQFHYLMVLRWLGFKSDFINIQHEERFEGKSSYNLKKLLKHAIIGVVYQSDKLLRLSIYIGFLFSIVSFTGIIWVLVRYFTSGLLTGWASIVIILLLGIGLVLIAIGVLGLYLGKTFEQVKNRPQYIIDKSVNL